MALHRDSFQRGEVLDDFFVDELFDGGEGDLIRSGLYFVDTY